VFMLHRLVFIPLLAVAALVVCNHSVAQQRQTSEHPIVPVIGIVNWISGNTISVATDGKLVDVIADGRTEIWKGRTFHDLSPIQVGDDFSSRCRADESGKLVAEAIWINIVNFFGLITDVDTGSFMILTNPNADPQSAYVKMSLRILVDENTVFSESAKDDIKVGRDVQMVGLDLNNGTVRAAKLTVYENKRPVQMGPRKVLPTTGPQKQLG
jgi:hypothetical protein